MPNTRPSASDRNLLFGILALQLDFITKDQLILGMQHWLLEKSRPLEEHLVQAGALQSEHRRLLAPLVAAHIKQHAGDPQQSLASVSSLGSVKDKLLALADDDLAASLQSLRPPPEPLPPADLNATLPLPLGESTSQGSRFRILRPFKQGGLGEVFIARDEEVAREVALKQIKFDWADDRVSRERFKREAEITGGLEHPGVVPVYGLGAYPDGRPFYAMKLVKGNSLKEVLDRLYAPARDRRPFAVATRKLELRRLVQCLIDVCEAMHYAHSRGVLHRDLKPGNIMIGRYGETFVVDWGMAKVLGVAATTEAPAPEDSLVPSAATPPDAPLIPSSHGAIAPTMPGKAMGTYQFMSPEQAEGKIDELTPAADVFSLGATLYQILTGRTPYHGEELVRKACQADFVRPRALEPSIPKPLEAICLKAMRLRPQDRYQSTRELALDLERYLADEPVTAWKEPLATRVRRWVDRHRPLAASAVSVTAASALSLAVLATVVTRYNQDLKLLNRELGIKKGEAEANLKIAEEQSRVAVEQRQAAEEQKRVAEEQKQLALEQRQRAERLADKALRFSSTVVSLVSSVDPLGIRIDREGRPQFQAFGTPQIEVLPFLERTVAKLNEIFADDPLDRANILASVGEVCKNLGYNQVAEGYLREALELCNRHGQPNDGLAATIAFNLAWTIHEDQSRRAESEQHFRTALRLRQSQTPPDADGLNLAKAGLLVALLNNGKAPEALLMFAPDIATAAIRGVNLLETIRNMDDARRLKYTGQVDEAAKKYLLAKQQIERFLPAGHILLAIVDIEMAEFLRATGDYDQAETLFRSALAVYHQRVGNHPRMAVPLADFAEFITRRGDYAEAEAALREALFLANFDRRVTGDEAHIVRRYSAVLEAAGRSLDAAQFLDATCASGALTDPAHVHEFQLRRVHNLLEAGEFARAIQALQDDRYGLPALADAKPLLARATFEQGDYPLARSLGFDALNFLPATAALRDKPLSTPDLARELGVDLPGNLADFRQQLGREPAESTHPGLMLPLRTLALHEALQGNREPALAALDRTQRISTARLSQDGRTSALLPLDRAVVAVALGNSDQALPAIQEAIQRADEKFPAQHILRSQIRTLAGKILATAQAPAEASRRFQEALQIRRASSPPGSAATWDLVLDLATALPVPKDRETFLSDCLLHYRGVFPYRSWRTAWLDNLLGQALLDQENFAAAESHLRTSYDSLAESCGPDHQLCRTAARRLIRLYQQWNKPDSAAQWEAKPH